MAFSARSLAGLLHPAADPGVRRVSGLFLASLAGHRVLAVPIDASTLRSFSLACSRLPAFSLSGEPALVPLPGDFTGPETFASSEGALGLATRGPPSGACVGTVRLQGFEPLVESAFTYRCFHLCMRAASSGFCFRKATWFLATGFGIVSEDASRRSRYPFPPPACPREVFGSPRFRVQALRFVGLTGCPAWQRVAMTPCASPWCLTWNGTFGGSSRQHSPGTQEV
jgi:hypothetical protein